MKAPLQKKSECKTGSLIPIANWSKHQPGVQSGGLLLFPIAGRILDLLDKKVVYISYTPKILPKKNGKTTLRKATT